MRLGSRPAFCFLLLLVGLLLASSLDARTLHWRSLAVEARLQADGRLDIVEDQTMVFSGDWNGGERTFDLRSGQQLELHSLSRVDADTGRIVTLTRGGLAEVDRYAWESSETLRWRSRLPSDPPFEDTAIRYRLEYSLTGVVQQLGDTYRLHHDFAFPDRVGMIERFTLDLELDPVWQTEGEVPATVELSRLAPGESFEVDARLRHSGPDPPTATTRWLGSSVPVAVFAAALGAMGLLWLPFRRHEARSARIGGDPLPGPVDEAWLEENLFDLLPEEAGALWDHRIGPHEVTALIARLVSEGKLESEVQPGTGWFGRPTMTLRLIADRDSFEGYEAGLIEKLFFDGRRTTDAKALRKRYRSTGFDPSATISPGIRRRLCELPGGGSRLAKPSFVPTLALFALFALLLGLELLMTGPESAGQIAASLFLAAPIPLIWAYVAASLFKKKVEGLAVASLWLLVPMGLLTAGCFVLAFSGSVGRILPGIRLGLPGLLALAVFPLAFHQSVLNRARTRDHPQITRKRRLLGEARRYFQRQLERAQPELQDEWMPYILAFGLGGRVDDWAKAHGGAAASRVSSTFPTGSGAAGGFTGGGGAFGGAGASAAWTAAAAGFSSGVSKPSSGGGSGGGGSGGGSSGGGGGGGW